MEPMHLAYQHTHYKLISSRTTSDT